MSLTVMCGTCGAVLGSNDSCINCSNFQVTNKPPLTVQQRNDPALRFDANKPRYELLPADALEELVKVYSIGARKYADRNWEKGMAWSRMFGSMMRHAWAFWRGEIHDPETGCHHMAMCAWNALGLCAFDLRKVGDDNRPLQQPEK